MKDRKRREKVTTRRSHSTTTAERESCGLLIMRVLQKSAMTAKESASDIMIQGIWFLWVLLHYGLADGQCNAESSTPPGKH